MSKLFAGRGSFGLVVTVVVFSFPPNISVCYTDNLDINPSHCYLYWIPKTFRLLIYTNEDK